MVMAVSLSVELGYVHKNLYNRTVVLLEKAQLPIYAPSNSTVDGFIRVMSGDKKNIHGNIRLVLLKSLGEAFICDDYSDVVMKSVIKANIAA
jgi:3-dehydroquinate synthase